MSVHKSDRAAVSKLHRKLMATHKTRKSVVNKLLAAKSRAAKAYDIVSGLQTSLDDIDGEINSLQAAIRGYSYGG